MLICSWRQLSLTWMCKRFVDISMLSFSPSSRVSCIGPTTGRRISPFPSWRPAGIKNAGRSKIASRRMMMLMMIWVTRHPGIIPGSTWSPTTDNGLTGRLTLRRTKRPQRGHREEEEAEMKKEKTATGPGRKGGEEGEEKKRERVQVYSPSSRRQPPGHSFWGLTDFFLRRDPPPPLPRGGLFLFNQCHCRSSVYVHECHSNLPVQQITFFFLTYFHIYIMK